MLGNHTVSLFISDPNKPTTTTTPVALSGRSVGLFFATAQINDFYSAYFLVQKKEENFHPILDLTALNWFWGPIWGVLLAQTLCSWVWLWIHHNPEQDSAVAKDFKNFNKVELCNPRTGYIASTCLILPTLYRDLQLCCPFPLRWLAIP